MKARGGARLARLLLLLLAAVLSTQVLPANAFVVHHPHIIAESVTGQSFLNFFGAPVYGTQRSRGPLVVISDEVACQPVLVARNVTRDDMTGLLVPRPVDLPLAGKVVLVFNGVSARQSQTSLQKPRCTVAQTALWAQQRGAVGVLVGGKSGQHEQMFPTAGAEGLPAQWVRSFSSAVRIRVDYISMEDADTLSRAVQEFGLEVDISLGVGLMEGYSYL